MDPVELSGRLLAAEVIGHEQYEHVQSQTTSTERNSELVDILVRRSYADYKRFLEILRSTGQGHVAAVLNSTGGQSIETGVVVAGIPLIVENLNTCCWNIDLLAVVILPFRR